jgi:predicted N-acetyltransferase YhbS
MLSWRKILQKNDLRVQHCHFGPLAVAPEAQGGEIGRRLIRVYCDQLDDTGQTGLLETDRRRHVAFYEEQGFRVVKEFRILGAQVWQLQRDPKVR